MDAGRSAAAVVVDRAGAVGIEGDGDQIGMAGKGLVDGVVDDLVDHVVEARAVVGVADIHAGTLADSVQPLQHLDGIGVVFLRYGSGFSGSGQMSSESARKRCETGLADGGKLPNRNGDFLPDFKVFGGWWVGSFSRA